MEPHDEVPESARPRGRVVALHVSHGGVPKHSVPRAEITGTGLFGDRQHDRRHHGGPDRAVCLLALEVIERLRGEGHPIGPGTTGENVTLAGLPWEQVRPGRRLRFAGGVELLVTAYALPCATIAASFRGGDIARLHPDRPPASARVYTRVLSAGSLVPGEAVELL